jgi:broad specificity phosphatase PhoE
MIAAWLKDFNQPPEGGETIELFNARIISVLDELKQKHDDQVVLLVGHAGSLNEILRVALGISQEKRIYFEMENASLSEVLISEEFVLLKRLNDTEHLALIAM